MQLDTTRARIISRLADLLSAIERPHPVRVAIDGRTAAGKSTISDELAMQLRHHRPVIQASIDAFYGLWVHRHNRRYLSSGAFYSDAYDYAALRAFAGATRPGRIAALPGALA